MAKLQTQKGKHPKYMYTNIIAPITLGANRIRKMLMLDYYLPNNILGT